MTFLQTRTLFLSSVADTPHIKKILLEIHILKNKPRPETMKYTIAAISAVALLATSVAAFTAFPQEGNSISKVTQASRKSPTALNMSHDDFAKSEIDSNDVVVFSKSYCPYCASTKELFDGLGVKYAVHELDKMGDDGPELQMALFKMTGQKSVPNVFVKGTHIGGNDDTQAAAKEGKLQEMLGL